MINAITTVIQALGLVAVLAGVALLLPLGGALVVDGLIVLAAAVAVELVDLRARSAPASRRSGPTKEGAA